MVVMLESLYSSNTPKILKQLLRSILQSILVPAFKPALYLRDYVSNDAGVWYLRNFLQLRLV